MSPSFQLGVGTAQSTATQWVERSSSIMKSCRHAQMTRRRVQRALIACMNHLERQSLALMLALGVLGCAGSTKQ
ncbi:MAG TPA: hypothetical protein VJV78_28920, partial [Polyangiales bacterium]|nr:hypothetical protein [Polyangiales bacterium]